MKKKHTKSNSDGTHFRFQTYQSSSGDFKSNHIKNASTQQDSKVNLKKPLKLKEKLFTEEIIPDTIVYDSEFDKIHPNSSNLMIQNNTNRIQKLSIEEFSFFKTRRQSSIAPIPMKLIYPRLTQRLVEYEAEQLEIRIKAKERSKTIRLLFKKMVKRLIHVLHFFDVLSTRLAHPLEQGWEYDPMQSLSENLLVTDKARLIDNSDLSNNVVLALSLSVSKTFAKMDTFKGWLIPHIRELFKKPPEMRSQLDLIIMQVFHYIYQINV